jgi:hypothetical protein
MKAPPIGGAFALIAFVKLDLWDQIPLLSKIFVDNGLNLH